MENITNAVIIIYLKKKYYIYQLSKKLNEKNDKELINDCIFYWNNWIDFLEAKNGYTDFEEYLKGNKNSR